MKFMALLLSPVMSYMFMVAKHPVTAIIAITSQTTVSCLLIFLLLALNWMAVMLFLIFMGGLLILFIYITSLASNEKFYLSAKTLAPLLTILTGMIFVSMVLKEASDNTFKPFHLKELIFYLYSENIIAPTSLAIFYLLLVLIIAVNIIKLQESPMRSIT